MAAPIAGPSSTDRGGVIPAAWPAQAADTIVDTIGKVRDKTTKPAITAARALVYGLLVAVGGTIAVVLLLITAFRFLEYIPGDIWIPYVTIGAVFSAVGIWLLIKANTPAPAGD